jgi:hypothetical protein
MKKANFDKNVTSSFARQKLTDMQAQHVIICYITGIFKG